MGGAKVRLRKWPKVSTSIIFALIRVIVSTSIEDIDEHDLVAFRDRAIASGAKRWDPELPQPSNSNSSWQTLVSDEFHRSLNQYPKLETVHQAAVSLRKILSCTSMLVLLIEGRIYMSLQHFEKLPPSHLAMVRTALQRSRHGRHLNLAYLYESGTRGSNNLMLRCRQGDLPYFVQAKALGYEKPGLLFPNHAFGNLSTWGYLQKYLGRFKGRYSDFAKRDQRCMWRGAITKKRCHGDFGNWARFCSVVRSGQAPDILDAKAVQKLKPRDPSLDTNQSACLALPYDEEMQRVFSLDPTSIKNFMASVMSHKDFARYRVLLSLPGVVGGSFSRHLNKLWNLGAIIALWNSPHVEWYYPALRHGHTHISLDCHTMIDELRHYANPEYASSAPTSHIFYRNENNLYVLRKNAELIYNEFLTPERISQYILQAFDALSAHLGQHLLLDDRSTRDKFFKQINCSNFGLVEISSSAQISLDMKGMPTDKNAMEQEDPGNSKISWKHISSFDPILGACAHSPHHFK